MREHIVLVVGTPGAGRTTAIELLGEPHDPLVPGPRPVIDFGEIRLRPDEQVRLYGVPERRRLDLMWSILVRRAIGVLLLVANDAPDPIADLLELLDEYHDVRERGGIVVGITRTDLAASPTPADYGRALGASAPSAPVPVFTVDPRDRAQLVIMMSVLAANAASRAMLRDR